MSAAQFKLDMFEGPLDLLLHLINAAQTDGTRKNPGPVF